MRVIAALFPLLAFLLAPAARAGDAPPPADVVVTLKPLTDAGYFPERNAPANVVSANESKISAEIAATVVALPAGVGAVVATGSVIARLDDRDAAIELQRAEAALAGAQARLSQSEAQLQRYHELAAEKFISPDGLQLKVSETESRRAELRAAQATTAAARRAVAKTIIRAPFKGAVRARHAAVGEMAAPGTPLLTLVDLTHLEVTAQVPNAYAATLAASDKIFWESSGKRSVLELLRVSPAINREARSVEARLAFVGKPLAPGLEGRIVWRDPRPHLPPDLVVRRDGHLGVFVAEAGKARFVVLPNAQEGRPATADFLPATTKIVVTGQQALRDGMAVR
ncbi:MAG: efflux RND transporter periplasmic adaptor subunit [Gammaproteobacteria bacterium]|nr:efflux RND transporter periplasmic adaptor subunit [Gammaproteobacteria bacterium]MBU1416207.1 efflux RND transporter periplasmic adaptor subunit [Gammaproteobacteria bacterium]